MTRMPTVTATPLLNERPLQARASVTVKPESTSVVRFGNRISIKKDVKLNQMLDTLSKALDENQVAAEAGIVRVGDKHHTLTYNDGSNGGPYVQWRLTSPRDNLDITVYGYKTKVMAKSILVPGSNLITGPFVAYRSLFPVIFVNHTFEHFSYQATDSLANLKLKRLVKKLHRLMEKTEQQHAAQNLQVEVQKEADRVQEILAGKRNPPRTVAELTGVPETQQTPWQKKREEFTRLLAELGSIRTAKAKIRNDVDVDVQQAQEQLTPLVDTLNRMKREMREAGNEAAMSAVMDYELQELKVKAKTERLQLLTQQQETTRQLDELMEHRLKRIEFQQSHALEMLDTMDQLSKTKQLQTMFENLNRQYKETGCDAGERHPDGALQKQFDALMAQLIQAEQDTRMMREMLEMDAQSALTQLRVKQRVEEAKIEMALPSSGKITLPQASQNSETQGTHCV